MYFSLVTISTVGYGDYTAAHDLGRMAAGSEAVLGQVFLVTFVALIVSRFAAHMPLGRPHRDSSPPEHQIDGTDGPDDPPPGTR